MKPPRCVARVIVAFVCGALGGAMAGCGPSGPATARVSGTVTLDGKPLGDIRVTYQPDNKSEEARGMGSYGLTDSSGKYELKMSDNERSGAIVGQHTVILADKLTEDVNDSDAGSPTKVKSRIPAKYAKTPLRVEVRGGEVNALDIELKSK